MGYVIYTTTTILLSDKGYATERAAKAARTRILKKDTKGKYADQDFDFLVSEELGVKWPNDSVSFADWKDNEAMIEGGVEQGMKGAEVVILFDGSDCYIVASMADAIPL